MKVFPVFVSISYEPGYFLGVASSELNAEQMKTAYLQQHPNCDVEVWWREVSIDEYTEHFL